MKFTSCLIFFFTGLMGGVGSAAGLPQMVKDLNTSAGTELPSIPNNSGVAGSHLFFTRLDRTHGAELWKCDLAGGGTSMVKDIWPGSGSSSLIFLSGSPQLDRADLGSIHYFTAGDGIHGHELWRSDGTREGTFMVKDIMEGSGGGGPHALTLMNGILYFFAADAAHGTELWRSDGTAEGTRMVKDIQPGITGAPGSRGFGFQRILGNQMYFTANDGSGQQLWITDGTEAGTVPLVTGMTGTVGLYPGSVTVSGNKAFFLNEDAVHGLELWRTNGTPEGTAMVKDLVAGKNSPAITLLVAASDRLYFLAVTPESGQELWKTDGTSEGTVLVKDMVPGPNSPDWLPVAHRGIIAEAGGIVYFAFDNGVTGTELWRTDGSAAGTYLLKDILPGSASSNLAMFNSMGGQLFFRADNGTSGSELWRTDGTSAGTVMVKDISPGNSSSTLEEFVVSAGRLFFRVNGRELWKSDGTAAGTVRLVESLQGTESSFPSPLTAAGPALYFAAQGGLWKSDGSAVGTLNLKDIQLDGAPVTLGNSVFFSGYVDGNGFELCKSNGTAAGTAILKYLNPGPEFESPSPRGFTAVGSQFYFSAQQPSTGRELWKSDGTAAGTSLVTDLLPGFLGSEPRGLTAMGGALYFVAGGMQSMGLWKTDGTAVGTVQLWDSLATPRAQFSNLVVWNGRLWFGLSGGNLGAELWASDGTPAGTVMTTKINPADGGLEFNKLLAGEDRLYFTARGSSFPTREVWASDGTTGGTVMLKGPMDIEHLAVAGNRAYFICDTFQNGLTFTSLWRSDGTVAGTIKLREIEGSTFRLPPANLTAVGDALYFSMHDNIHGGELWKTDGTLAGTSMVADITGDSGSSDPADFKLVENSLFFSAQTDAYGRELWKVSIQVPELTVSGNGRLLDSGEGIPSTDAHTDFGGSPVANGSVLRSFVVKNAGMSNLTLGNISLSGSGAADFAITAQPPAVLAPGQTASIGIRFDPAALGLRQSRISIPSNDEEQNPFTFTIAGTGTGSKPARDSWRLTWFGTTADEGNAADGADPDKDGMTNLMEWACLQDPTAAGALPLAFGIVEEVFEFQYPRNSSALQEGMVFTVEWSDSLSGDHWSVLGVTEEIVSGADNPQLIKAKIPRGNTSSRFVRLKVTGLP